MYRPLQSVFSQGPFLKPFILPGDEIVMMTKNDKLEHLYPVAGIKLSSVAAGIRYQGRKDLVIFELAEGSNTVGVFTRNRFCAAPVILSKKHISHSSPAYFIVNTGNANAGTGQQGLQDALVCCEHLAMLGNVKVENVLPFSTGVIGEKLPVEAIIKALPKALENLSATQWAEAAEGIMTTDTRPKAVSVQVEIEGEIVSITGIAKGAGMIRPDMATMLAFIACDAKVDTALLQEILNQTLNTSFNRITIDGDTSTNDCCMLSATGKSGVVISKQNKATYEIFYHAVETVCSQLARAIVMDGEGATKFITIDVRGGQCREDCLAIAYTVAHSPLVKTAFFASDPNWGRILAAVGRAPVQDLDVAEIDIFLDEVQIVKSGGVDPQYAEADGSRVMQRDNITIQINLNAGEVAEQVWTTDLSNEYVNINADYRS